MLSQSLAHSRRVLATMRAITASRVHSLCPVHTPPHVLVLSPSPALSSPRAGAPAQHVHPQLLVQLPLVQMDAEDLEGDRVSVELG